MQILTEQQKDVKLQEIAAKMGVPVTALLEGKTKEQVIAEYESGTLKMLNDQGWAFCTYKHITHFGGLNEY